jgi:multiple sugar transport system substrate-binding protein
MGKKGLLFIASLLGLSVLAGCGGEGSATQAQKGQTQETQVAGKALQVSSEPVTLTILAAPNQLDNQRMLIDPVKKKYSNITLNIVQTGKGNQIQDMVAAGNLPDMYTGYTSLMASLNQMDIFSDITPLAKSMNIDLGRFESVVLDGIRASGANNELYGLPFNLQFNALYYNKTIFDKFGVPYPADGMTWDDTIELGKKLTRVDGGVQFRGLDPSSLTRIAYPRSLNMIDRQTGKANVDNEQWRIVFNLGKKILDIPGNMRKSNANARNEFSKAQTLAMLPDANIIATYKEASEAGFNWDMAQYPSYKDLPNTYGMVDPWIMFILKTSKHREQAMQVLDVLTSDEVQTLMAKTMIKMSALKNPDIKKALGGDIPYLQGKRFSSVFKSHPAPNPSFTKYYSDAQKILDSEFWDYAAEKQDLNTALREAQDAINKVVSEDQTK